LLLGFFIVAFPTIVFAGHFSAREVASVEVERELETEILHQQWSLNKTVPRERVVDRKKLVPEKKPNLKTMAPVPGMFDVFLNHTAAAAIGFFIVAFSTIVFAGHFGAREVDSKKLVPEKKPNLETMAAVPGKFDVFLNHRGPDVKRRFASHLYEALQEAGCRPFLDMESLEKGQHGQKKIYEALGCASVHVAIFSKHYADSEYCLDELCAMLESEKIIIPVFYDVSPNDLHCKLHNGPYTKAFRKIHGRKHFARLLNCLASNLLITMGETIETQNTHSISYYLDQSFQKSMSFKLITCCAPRVGQCLTQSIMFEI
jgi:hypothetical protein